MTDTPQETEKEINSMIVYGDAGTGKTTMVARAMPNALWVVTSKSNLTSYNTWVRKCPAEATQLGCKEIPKGHVIEVPSKRINPDSGILEDLCTKDFLATIIAAYCKKVTSGEITVDGIVFDEFSTFVSRVHKEMSASETNPYAAINNIKKWTADICQVPLATKLPMCLICHSRDPKYDEEKGNTLQYKGGPAFPIGTMIKEICPIPDAVLQLVVREPQTFGAKGVERVMLTEAHPKWERKCRVWGIAPEIEPDLRKLLQQAGW